MMIFLFSGNSNIHISLTIYEIFTVQMRVILTINFAMGHGQTFICQSKENTVFNFYGMRDIRYQDEM